MQSHRQERAALAQEPAPAAPPASAPAEPVAQEPAAPAVQPYAWHYTSTGGVSVWHTAQGPRLDADLAAAADHPRSHRVTEVYTAAAIAAARREERAEALLNVIQRLNSNPYSLTKMECIDEVQKLRAALRSLGDE